MVTAVLLLNAEYGQVQRVAEELASIPGISEVYSVGGRFDMVALIRVKTNEELADLVTGNMARVKGIKSTETLISFRANSRHDLEAMFSVGME